MDVRDLKDYVMVTGLIVKEIGETTMVYNSHNGDMYEFNDTGALLFDCLKKSMRGDEILSMICKDYDVDADTVILDLAPILDRFIELNLITIVS